MPASACRKRSRASTTCKIGVEVALEGALDRLGLALTEQAIIDEDARDLRPDCLEQHGGPLPTNRHRRTSHR